MIIDRYFKSEGQTSAISQAAGIGSLSIVKLLLEHASNAEREASQDAIISAARAGKLGMVDFLLSQGFDINYQSPGRSQGHETALLLLCATRTPYPRMLQLLLEKGADINAQSSHGDTPRKTQACATTMIPLTPALVHQAAESSNPDIVEILLSSGAQTDTQNLDGDVPLSLFALKVSEFCHHQHVNDLKPRDPNPRLQTFNLISRATSNVNSKNNKGNTPLHVIALHSTSGWSGPNRVPAADILLREGADPTLRNEAGQTALEICAGNKEYNDTHPSPKRDELLPEFLAVSKFQCLPFLLQDTL